MTTPETSDERENPGENHFIQEAMQSKFLRVRRMMEGFHERLDRMENNANWNRMPNDREREVGGNGNGRQNREEEEEEEQDRRNRRGNRNGRRNEEEDDDLGDIRTSIPTFAGKRDPDVYLEWESKVEKIFSCHNYSERKKLKKVVLEFTEFANVWWDREVLDRRRNEDDQIGTWRELKVQMRKQWVPASYTRELHLQLQELVQGRMTIAEYDYEERLLLKKLGIVEDPQTTISRFIKGLNWEIQDEVDMGDYLDYEDLVKKAIQIEKKLQKRKKRNQNWRTSRDTKSDFRPRMEANKPIDKSKTFEKGKAKIGEPLRQNSSIKCSDAKDGAT